MTRNDADDWYFKWFPPSDILGCVCGEINTRHCPIHGTGQRKGRPEGRPVVTGGESLSRFPLRHNLLALGQKLAARPSRWFADNGERLHNDFGTRVLLCGERQSRDESGVLFVGEGKTVHLEPPCDRNRDKTDSRPLARRMQVYTADSGGLQDCPGLNADGTCPYGFGRTCCAVAAVLPVQEKPAE